jgi:CopG antitoxin of type II toxin-antitoxin system
MNDDKTSLSQAKSYQEAGEYWDNHDLGDSWDQTKAVEFSVDIKSSTTYFPIESTLSEQLRKLAGKHGVSPETLINLWLQERVGKEQVDSAWGRRDK